MFRRFAPLFLISLLAFNLLSISVSASSGLVYNSAATNDIKSSTSNYVSVNHDNSIIAGAYSKEVVLYHTSNYSVIDVIEFQREIYDVKFSPDGNHLAITTVSTPEFSDSVIIYDVLENEVFPDREKTNSVRSSISWMPDSNYLAVSNFQNGINLIKIDTMEVEIQYSNEHLADITCIEFSNDGQLLISGDKNGVLNLWNSDGTFTGKSFNLQSEITGCGFNSQNQRVSAVSIDGEISTWTITGNLLHEKSINSAMGLKWSKTLDILYVLEYGNEPRLLSLDGSTFNEISSTYFIHKSLDFDLNELSNGVISDIYVSTDSNHITNYAVPTAREGYGETGADLDGDKIPDSIDDDDDGDSFLDDWDFNCPEDVSDCKRNPDVDNIRSIGIRISDDSVIVEDEYTFGLLASAEIRNLTRRSIISDQQISYEETNLFEKAVCNNLDSSDIIQSWRNNLELSIGQVTNGSLQCIVTGGLSFTQTFDPNGVKFMLKFVFDIIPNATLPLDLSIKEQIVFSDSTITHLVENHPIFVSQISSEGNNEGQIWWENEGSLTITFEELQEEENVIDTIIEEILSNSLYLSIVIILISITFFLIIRRRNRITIDLDDENSEELDYESEEDTLHDSAPTLSKPKPIEDDEIILRDDDESVNEQKFIPSEDSPVNRKSFALDIEEESVPEVKRRVGKMNRNKQGPIMSTKRKRLGGTEEPQVKKTVGVRAVKKDIKTRKVKKVSNEIDDNDVSWEID